MVRTTDADTTDDAPNNCPVCGSFTAHEDDPGLPPTHVNVVCPSSTCHVGLVYEGVEKADAGQYDDVLARVTEFVDANPQADVDHAVTFARNHDDAGDIPRDLVEAAFDKGRR